MQHDELKTIIDHLRSAKGDLSNIEAKRATGGFPTRLWETISAFANTAGGGIIILGLEEKDGDFSITGVTEPARMQQNLASVCDQMVPPVRALIEHHELDGKVLVTAEIPEIDYRDKPCYYQGSGMLSGSFVRVFDGDRQLTQYEVQGFLDGRGQPAYDIEAIPAAGREHLDDELLAKFISRLRRESKRCAAWDDATILRTHRVVTEHSGRVVPTLAGLLCFGTFPQEFFPGLTIHVLAYPARAEGETGSRGERLLDNVRIEGPLPVMIAEAVHYIRRNIRRGRLVKGLLGEDVYEYPDDFFREALINAVGHRDYSALARGSAVQVKLFPDRMEISSPGGLFGPVTADRLGEQGLQASRNSHLMKLLEDLPVPGEQRVLCENRGTGIPTMIHAVRRAGLEPPQFRDSRLQFTVVCRNHTLLDDKTLAWLRQFAGIELSDAQRSALAYARTRERMTNGDYCRLNECDSRTAGRELAGLVAHNLLQSSGVGRWTYYVLTNPAAVGIVPPRQGRRKDHRADLLLFLRERHEASAKEIGAALGMKLPVVQYWLRKLLREKQIRTTTRAVKSPNVKYRPRA